MACRAFVPRATGLRPRMMRMPQPNSGTPAYRVMQANAINAASSASTLTECVSKYQSDAHSAKTVRKMNNASDHANVETKTSVGENRIAAVAASAVNGNKH